MMNTKMKGLLKGLRYISQIFEAKEEEDDDEDEMQIGLPTDVKHVAHIGWDGPSVSPPNWMNEFQSSPINTTKTRPNDSNHINPLYMDSPSPSQYRSVANSPSQHQSVANSPYQDLPTSQFIDLPLPRSSRRSSRNEATTSGSPSSSPNLDRHSRRNKSTEITQIDSLEGSSRHARRTHRVKEQSELDPPDIPKQIRRKKKSSRSISGEGSVRASRSKVVSGYTDPGPASEGNEGLVGLKPIYDDRRL